MELTRQEMGLLLNAFYDLAERSIAVRHPSDSIGELVRIELGDPQASTVEVTTGAVTYESLIQDIKREYGEQLYEELPDQATYVRSMVASGLVDFQNRGEIDTNLLPWRMHDTLEIDPDLYSSDGEPSPVNGYTLAEGIEEELKHSHRYGQDAMPVEELADVFGPEFRRLDGQPTQDSREMRLGLKEYRRLRETRPHDIAESGEGDADIIDGCQAYYENEPTDVILFSNDYGFVDRAREQKVPAMHVGFDIDVPKKITATWEEIGLLLYEFAVLFGVIVLPGATLYGVWEDKDEHNWRAEEIDVDCRSDRLADILERDRSVVRNYEAQ